MRKFLYRLLGPSQILGPFLGIAAYWILHTRYGWFNSIPMSALGLIVGCILGWIIAILFWIGVARIFMTSEEIKGAFMLDALEVSASRKDKGSKKESDQ